MYAPNPHPEKKDIMPIDGICSVVGPVARKFGVKTMYLFGSVARGDFTEDSDYDFSIDESRPMGYYEMLDFIDGLADVLGRDVDVVIRSDLGDMEFVNRMNSDEIHIYPFERGF